jgi:hypothetical protein
MPAECKHLKTGRTCHRVMTGIATCGGPEAPVAPGSGSAALTVALCDRGLDAAAGARRGRWRGGSAPVNG